MGSFPRYQARVLCPKTLLFASTRLSPQTMFSPHTMFSPQTTFSPQTIFSPHTMFSPHTTFSPQTMFSPQMMLVAQAVLEVANASPVSDCWPQMILAAHERGELPMFDVVTSISGYAARLTGFAHIATDTHASRTDPSTCTSPVPSVS